MGSQNRIDDSFVDNPNEPPEEIDLIENSPPV
jgi:hypothetical protein